jgi:hypothetical protein
MDSLFPEIFFRPPKANRTCYPSTAVGAPEKPGVFDTMMILISFEKVISGQLSSA